MEALCLFKHGILPQWEDVANTGGGQWHWRPNVDQQDKGAGLDALWEELVLAMIGGISFGGCANICGLRVVDKSRSAWPKGKGRQGRGRATCSYRFELWFSAGLKTEAERSGIAKELEALLSPVQSGLDFALKMHQQSLTQEADYQIAKATYKQEKEAEVAAAAAMAAEKKKEKKRKEQKEAAVETTEEEPEPAVEAAGGAEGEGEGEGEDWRTALPAAEDGMRLQELPTPADAADDVGFNIKSVPVKDVKRGHVGPVAAGDPQ